MGHYSSTGSFHLIVSAFDIVHDQNSDCLVVFDVGSSVDADDNTLKHPADTAGAVDTAVDGTAAGTATDTAVVDTSAADTAARSKIAAGIVGTAGSAVDDTAAHPAGTAAESAENAAY